MNSKIAILGSGSWATAIAKVLHKKDILFSWYFRNEENIVKFLEKKHNPNYLTSSTFDTSKIIFSPDLKKTIVQADILILAIPSIYLEKIFSTNSINISAKKIVSLIKGIIPSNNNLLVSEFLQKKYEVSPENFCMLSGPSHSEEIAMEKLSFLTIVGASKEYISKISNLFKCDYIKTSTSTDVKGVEYATILKNIMGIAVGICYGLNFGNNFIAVLVSNAILEMERFIYTLCPSNRKIKNSPYLGDLLTTTYSQYSRNRTYGTLIAKGYKPKTAILKMRMIVEGYYSLKYIKKTVEKHQIHTPIINAVYAIIYKEANIKKTIQNLIKSLK